MMQVVFLLSSYTGYFMLMSLLFRARKAALYPALLVSSLMLVGFISGLLGCMQQVYDVLYYAGFALLPACIIYDLVKKLKLYRRMDVVIPYLVMLVGTCVLYVILNGRFIYAYDDFSHWARIARVISTNMRFPIETDALTHASYPIGIPLVIAYITNAVGNSDGIWLFAQAFILLSFWVSLLTIDRKPLVQIILVGFVVMLMHYNISLEALNVDNMLAAAAFSCVAICLAEERRFEENLILLSIVLCSLVMIKNSGVFLAVIIACYAVWLCRRRNKIATKRLLCLVLPFALLLVWNGYVANTFTSRMSHRMSIDYYQEILNDKTWADLLNIVKLISSLILNPQRNHALWLIPGYVIMMLVYKKLGWLKKHMHVFVFAAVLFCIYEIGMVLMYIFSMPMNEIQHTNASEFGRYNNTITAVLLAVLLNTGSRICVHAAKENRGSHRIGAIAGLVMVGCVVFGVLSQQYVRVLTIEERIKTSPSAYSFSQYRTALAELPPNSSHVICLDSEGSQGYHNYMSSYYLYSKDVVFCFDDEEATAIAEAEPGRYYINLNSGVIREPIETVGVELLAAPITDGTNQLSTAGYKENTRYSVSAVGDVTAHGWDITGYIPAKAGDVVYLKNVTWYPAQDNDARGGVYWYNVDREFRANQQSATTNDLADWAPIYDAVGNIVQITVPEGVGSSTAYLRIVCQDIVNASVISVND